MEYHCTICCKRKRRDREALPAIRRYLSRRIQFVLAESKRVNRPFLILSGRYGLLTPNDPIPWYDHVLHEREVDALARDVEGQLDKLGVTSLVFYARPRDTAGWGPYFALLERACSRHGIPLRIRLLDAGLV